VKPWGNREGQRSCAPTAGIHRPAQSGSLEPLHRASASAARPSIAMANVHGKSGAPQGPATRRPGPPTAPKRCSTAPPGACGPPTGR
jgi:hypothetical protein